MHPFDEYWELKYRREKKTNLIISFVILALLSLTRMLQEQYNGLVNYNNPKEFNSLCKLYMLFCRIILVGSQLVINYIDRRRR